MNKKPEVTVLASYARDRIIRQSKPEIIKPGGPAHYISLALNQPGVAFNLLSPPPVDVIIRIDGQDERGRLEKPPKNITVDLSLIKTSAVLISTLLREIKLQNISSYSGMLFIDAQGFVRDSSDFGKKRPWRPSRELQEVITCLKATEREAKHIDSKAIEYLKQNKMLLITHGSAGSTLYDHGQIHRVKPVSVLHPPNTIGAGDTMFAVFALLVVGQKTPLASIAAATKAVSKFLRSK